MMILAEILFELIFANISKKYIIQAVQFGVVREFRHTGLAGTSVLRGGKSRPALNIALIFMESHSHADAIFRARDLGLQQLALCESSAARLPSNAGALLLGFSADMRRKLAAISSLETC